MGYFVIVNLILDLFIKIFLNGLQKIKATGCDRV